MDEEDDLMEELRELGEHGATDFDLDESQRGLEEQFLGDDLDGVGAPAPSYRPSVPQPQPCNQATMVCLRGPCQFLWAMTTRFGHDDGETVHMQRWRVCLRHYYETNLADQNVYACEQWWPEFLSFVPQSLRPVFRRQFRVIWEAALKARGYDFSWRHFSLDSFEWDDPEKRKFSGPGAGHKYDAYMAEKEQKTGFGVAVPEDKEAA